MTEVLKLSFDPLLSWPAIFALAGVAALAYSVYFWLYRRAWLSRILLLVLGLLALANPSLVQEEREPLPSVAAIILDESESMGFGQRGAIATAAYDAIQSAIAADPSLEMRAIRVSSQMEGTRLIGALEGLMADVPRDRVAGAILITDGQVHDLPEDLSRLTELGPFHAVITGDPDSQDRRITLVEAPDFDIVGNQATFLLRIDDPNVEAAAIRWSINGGAYEYVELATGVDTAIQIETERRGENIIVFETPPGPEELTLANNRTAATLSGVRDGLRVLLVTGRPNASGRVWRDLLKSDPSVDLVHFTILRPPYKLDMTPLEEMALIAFPTQELFEEKLDGFDLLIFDQYERRGVITLTYLSDVARYVAEGGALLVIAGESFAGPASLANTPLAGILPALPTGDVRVGAMQPQRSQTGARHTITEVLDDTNWGQWLRFIEAEAKTGDVLITAPQGEPLLAVDRVGEGRVAQLLSDQIWLWARNYDGGGPFADLIRRTVHWLMKEPELDERQLKFVATGDKLEVQLRTLADQAAPLNVEAPDGTQNQLAWQQNGPGSYSAEVPIDQLGLYRAQSGGLEAVTLNGPANPIEFTALEATADPLNGLLEQTDGGVFAATQVGQSPDIRAVAKGGRLHGDGWLGLNQRGAYAVRNTSSLPILPGILSVSLILLFVLIAWRREGR